MIEVVFGLIFWFISIQIDKAVLRYKKEKERKQRVAELFRDDRPKYINV